MQFLQRFAAAWFEASPPAAAPTRAEQLVFVTVPACAGVDPALTCGTPSITELTDQLQREVGLARVHRVESRAGEITIWIYGVDAEVTWGQASKVVLTSPLTPSGFVLLRHGGPGAFERQIAFEQ